jgi:protein involved in polysaccharide export with SLBB domain
MIAGGLTGCFSSHPKDIEAFLKPHETQVTADKYILQPPDEIEVHCTRVPELHLQRQRIRPDGKISFEGIGEFMAAGKTPQELGDEMQKHMSALYTLVGDKPIEVRLIAYQSKVYFDRMSAHGDTTKNVLLQEGDVIYVPPTVLAAIALKLEEFIRPIAMAFSGANLVQNGVNSPYVGGYNNESSSYGR